MAVIALGAAQTSTQTGGIARPDSIIAGANHCAVAAGDLRAPICAATIEIPTVLTSVRATYRRQFGFAGSENTICLILAPSSARYGNPRAASTDLAIASSPKSDGGGEPDVKMQANAQ